MNLERLETYESVFEGEKLEELIERFERIKREGKELIEEFEKNPEKFFVMVNSFENMAVVCDRAEEYGFDVPDKILEFVGRNMEFFEEEYETYLEGCGLTADMFEALRALGYFDFLKKLYAEAFIKSMKEDNIAMFADFFWQSSPEVAAEVTKRKIKIADGRRSFVIEKIK